MGFQYMMTYLASSLSGYIGALMATIGVVVSFGPILEPLIPSEEHRRALSALLTLLGCAKTWLSTSPFPKGAQ